MNRPLSLLDQIRAGFSARGWDPSDADRYRMEAPAFPTVPADLSGLSDAELADFVSAASAFGAAIQAGEIELTGDQQQLLDPLVTAVEAARGIVTERAAAAPPTAEQVAAMAARLAPVPDPAPAADPPAPAPAADPPAPAPAAGDPAPAPAPAVAPIAAGGTPRPQVAPLTPAAPAAPVPVGRPDPIRPPTTIVAGGATQGVGPGGELPSLREAAVAMIDRREALGRAGFDGSGPPTDTVFSLRANIPEERTLYSGDTEGNQRKLDAVVSPKALAASGGFCALFQPYYDLQVLAGAHRPVKSALPGFGSDGNRGGVTLMPPPRLTDLSATTRTVADGATTNASPTVTSATAAFDARDIGGMISATGIPAGAYIIKLNSATSVDISVNATATATGLSVAIVRPGAVGYITPTQDQLALNGTLAQVIAATKPYIHVTCPSSQTYSVNAITRQLEFGNFSARAYPEQVEAWMKLLLAVYARRAETALLDQMSAATLTTQIAVSSVIGAARDLVANIVKFAAYYRNTNRMLEDAVLRWLGPAWVIDLAVADLVKGSGYEAEFYSMARAMFRAALVEHGIVANFYADSGTGKGQLMNGGVPLADGGSLTFPSSVVWYLFAEGTFAVLEAPMIDLGIIRDAGLVNLNNYRVFAEGFETIVPLGIEALEITQSCAATGTFAGPAYGSSTVGSPVAIPTAF